MTRRRPRTAHKSYYPLTDVMQKVAAGRCVIRGNAEDCALHHFGWNRDEIIKAIRLLEEKHFCKSITSERNAYWVYDVYKARLLGENVYIHLYIDDIEGRLIVNSCKKQ